MCLIEVLLLKNTPKCRHLATLQTDRFYGLSSTWLTVQNLLDNAHTGMSLMHDCPALLIDSATGQNSSTVMHSTSLWLAFLASVQQGGASVQQGRASVQQGRASVQQGRASVQQGRASVQQGRALECVFVVLNGMSMHCHAYWKYTRSLRGVDKITLLMTSFSL